jgi:hypothetical protein
MIETIKLSKEGKKRLKEIDIDKRLNLISKNFIHSITSKTHRALYENRFENKFKSLFEKRRDFKNRCSDEDGFMEHGRTFIFEDVKKTVLQDNKNFIFVGINIFRLLRKNKDVKLFKQIEEILTNHYLEKKEIFGNFKISNEVKK